MKNGSLKNNSCNPFINNFQQQTLNNRNNRVQGVWKSVCCQSPWNSECRTDKYN